MLTGKAYTHATVDPNRAHAKSLYSTFFDQFWRSAAGKCQKKDSAGYVMPPFSDENLLY